MIEELDLVTTENHLNLDLWGTICPSPVDRPKLQALVPVYQS